MSVLWIAVLALSAPPIDAAEPAPVTTPLNVAAETSPLPPRSAAELDQATRDALRRWARTSDKQADVAARELLALYKELGENTRLAPGQRNELLTRVRNRLVQLALQISKRAAHDSRQALGVPKSVRGARQLPVLGQMGIGAGQPGGAGGAFGNNANDDAGEDLVDLITKTVAPKTWEANGGPGTIYYWRTQRAIVARTTAEVHEDLSGVLEQLNRASH